MPSSNLELISPVMDIVFEVRPKSVLDIGIGFGKFGFLCREYLELWDGRNKYGDWQKRIDGVEAFPQYVTSLQKQIYDNIYVGDARELVPKLDYYYDLILLIDVIEHFSLEDGAQLLQQCSKHSRACIISTPVQITPQGAAFDNVYETHRSQWTAAHFAMFPQRLFVPHLNALLCYIQFDGRPIQEACPLKSAHYIA